MVSKRTLPVLMYVATSVKPAASTALMIESLGNFRVGPRLIARRNPMYVATPGSSHRRNALPARDFDVDDSSDVGYSIDCRKATASMPTAAVSAISCTG